MAVDARSEKNISTLKPEVQPLARKLIELATEQGINAKVISGYRSYQEQDALYAKGRTAPGPKVTKARAGYSYHNFGLAFDVGIFSKDGKEYFGESPDYAKVGRIGKNLSLEWGGDWDFCDPPHFQFNPRELSLAEMRDRTAQGKDLLT
jgi:peptidoglycan LD-endopeptidase CwlK